MKTKLKTTAFLVIAGTISLAAQNASSNANNAGISGTDCSAYGYQALRNNSSGSDNSALGYQSLYTNTTGQRNTAAGYLALYGSDADYNTGVGGHALFSTTSGYNNTGVGTNVLNSLQTGYENVSFGKESGTRFNGNSYGNTAIGTDATAAGSTDHNQSAIGAQALTYQSDMVELGDANITVVEGKPSAYSTSDARFKFNISESDVKGLDFIRRLRPVTYYMNTRKLTEHLTQNMTKEDRAVYLKRDFSASSRILRTGFIAQEAEKAAADAGYDFDGIHKPKNNISHYSISYEEFVVPLVKAVQEQQQLIKSYQARVAQQKAQMAELSGQSSPIQQQPDFMEDGFELNKAAASLGNQLTLAYKLPGNVGTAYVGIYDLSGRQVAHLPITVKGVSSVSINREGFVPGIYLCTIVADGNLSASRKLLIAEN